MNRPRQDPARRKRTRRSPVSLLERISAAFTVGLFVAMVLLGLLWVLLGGPSR